jgi:hypothetical protein
MEFYRSFEFTPKFPPPLYQCLRFLYFPELHVRQSALLFSDESRIQNKTSQKAHFGVEMRLRDFRGTYSIWN